MLAEALSAAIKGLVTITRFIQSLNQLDRHLRDAPRKRRRRNLATCPELHTALCT
jgi:hypothetical protein